MNIKSVDALPEGYQLDREINLEKDKRLFWMINILSIVLFIPFVLIAIVLQISFTIEISAVSSIVRFSGIEYIISASDENAIISSYLHSLRKGVNSTVSSLFSI